MMADLRRLVGHSSVATFLVLHVLRLTAGQSRKDETAPIGAQELADLLRDPDNPNDNPVRDVQRQLSEMKERGIIGLKTVKDSGGVKYKISLQLKDWRGLPGYAKWKREQVVPIDESSEAEDAEDTEVLTPISKDAVRLTAKPQRLKARSSSRAIAVAVGVRSLSVQNESADVDTTFSAVVQSGRLVVSVIASNEQKGESKANDKRHGCRAGSDTETEKGESKANDKRHGCRVGDLTVDHPRAAELISFFDPLLRSRKLSLDISALYDACVAIGDTPRDTLNFWLHGPEGRAKREIKTPRTVVAICRECRANWEKSNPAAGSLDEAREILRHPKHYSQEEVSAARKLLEG
jgi:hypothetical protein